MKALEELDRLIAGVVKRWAAKVGGEEQPPALLEVRKEVLREVTRRIEAFGDDQYVFPFNRVIVRVGPGSESLDAESLEADVREVLADAGARARGVRLSVEHTDGPLEVLCLREKEKPAAMPPAKLVVLRGEAEETELPIQATRVNIGRLREVLAAGGDLRRRNDIAFKDTESTVSREHASIQFDAHCGRFRLYDSMSQRGTSVVRDGRTIAVPRGDLRGVQLQNGDEIHLGNARVRFES